MEHGSRFRRQSCGNKTQHILFVLDTSGSIGQVNFARITRVLADLTALFCKGIRIAVMTFDHEYYVEFCFDEYGDGQIDQAANDIRDIPYIREGQPPGTRWTHTAGAAQCACEYMLTPTCGLTDPAADCINVVFITDGQANDPTLDVCTEIRCLHQRRGVNTFAIGIGIRDYQRLECMRDDDLELDEYHLFKFGSVTDLEEQFELITNRIMTPPYNYPCSNLRNNPVNDNDPYNKTYTLTL
jgi:hypothetical protein